MGNRINKGWASVILTSVLALAACDDAPVSMQTSQAVGSGGGSVVLTDGSGVNIPSGALSTTVMVTVAAAPASGDAASHTLHLSSIFKWYEEDFTDWLKNEFADEEHIPQL